jgi:hypothetical protein
MFIVLFRLYVGLSAVTMKVSQEQNMFYSINIDLKEQPRAVKYRLQIGKPYIISTLSPQSFKRRDGMEEEEAGNPRQLKHIAVPKTCKANNHVG